jgi:hypothetical protein
LKQKKIKVATFTVLWIKATIMKGNCPMHKHNITTIAAHPTPGRSKESVTQPNIAQFQYNKSTIPIHVPKEKLKNHGRWHKKNVEQSKAVISSRNEHPLAKIVQ